VQFGTVCGELRRDQRELISEPTPREPRHSVRQLHNDRLVSGHAVLSADICTDRASIRSVVTLEPSVKNTLGDVARSSELGGSELAPELGDGDRKVSWAVPSRPHQPSDRHRDVDLAET
jgi:hypothetical protein